MNNKQKDFIKYLILIIIQILISFIFLIGNSKLNKNDLFTKENFELFIFGIIGNVLINLLNLIQLLIERFLQFEIFTYVLLVVGGFLLIYGFCNFKYEIIPCIIGISLLISSLFSRIILWKYDKSVINKKEIE